ncbi:hypothetical protein ACJIZ3_020619 [Penstemon smallii]|uniref:WD repeat-containing protein 76 n=1 Tax=Penstemon smallii TaxID=265156 RepID=A0ABD3SJQ5_9LAMI
MGRRREKMTEYERRRLENIKRNEQMLAALNIQSRLNDLTTAKRQRDQSKSYKRSPIKKPKTEGPVVLRRSLRTRGVPPDAATASGLSDDIDDKKQMEKTSPLKSFSAERKSPRKQGPLQMKDAYSNDDESDRKLIETISQCFENSLMSERDTVDLGSSKFLEKKEGYGAFEPGKRVLGSVDVEALQLKRDNVARLVSGRITSLRFFPTLGMSMVVVGNKFGNVGFWNVNAEKEDGDGIYLYHPHPGPISGIVIDPFSISKVYSSCYDGFIRLMDVEKEVFDMVHYSEDSIYSISLSPNDTKSLYFSEGMGVVSMWDMRAGKSSFSCDLHEKRVNTLDFNSGNGNLMATSSTDGTACIWDLRHLSAGKPKSLKTVDHKRSVHSAYFSPTGKFLATTSIADKVGLSSGSNYEDTSMIYHYNQTGRWISPFRGIWGWDDSSIFIGNMKRGVDVISVEEKKTVATLESDYMSAIPCRFDAHPYNVGMLAGATSGGQVYIWTP